MIRLRKINWALYLALLFTGVGPIIYSTLRLSLINNLPSDDGINIASQIQWFGLILEILQEGFILPLFFLIGRSSNKLSHTVGKLKSCYLIVILLYAAVALGIRFNLDSLMVFIGNKALIEESADYINLEIIASFFLILIQINQVALALLNKIKSIYILLTAQIVLSVVCDILLFSPLSISLHLGVMGLGYSSIISNASLFIISSFLTFHRVNIFKVSIDFSWCKEWFKLGMLSALESTIRNIVYALIVLKAINSISEQSNYWQVTTFIWVWLMVPITKLGELIKQDSGKNRNSSIERISSYTSLTAIIVSIWIVLIPSYFYIFESIIQINNPLSAFKFLLFLLPFYIIFAFGNIWSSYLYGLGKINIILKASVMINLVYYPIAYIIFIHNNHLTLYSVGGIFGCALILNTLTNYILFKMSNN